MGSVVLMVGVEDGTGPWPAGLTAGVFPATILVPTAGFIPGMGLPEYRYFNLVKFYLLWKLINSLLHLRHAKSLFLYKLLRYNNREQISFLQLFIKAS